MLLRRQQKPNGTFISMVKMDFMCGRCLATFPKLWFDLCTGTCEWIFMSGAELCCTLDSASSHSFQQGPLKNTKLNLLSVHIYLEREYFERTEIPFPRLLSITPSTVTPRDQLRQKSICAAQCCVWVCALLHRVKWVNHLGGMRE